MSNASRINKESWGTRIGVILAVTGSAVGLGNFLRFPGLAAQHGGGAFMIPYAVAFLLLGLPIAWVEWSLGRYGGSQGYNSLPGVFRSVWRNRASPYLGVLGLIIPVMIYMYYVYVEAWCLGYAVRYAMGDMAMGTDPAAYDAFFGRFVGAEEDGSVFAAPFDSSLIYLLICFMLNFVLIYRGLNKGIEWFCRWAMPALVACALIVLARVLTLGTPDSSKPDQSLFNGLGYMWNPSTPDKTLLESLANPEIWLAAAGQIFFSLSVGFGIVITYASYLKRDDDIALSSITASSGNGFCEVVLGGMITIPAAFVFLGPAFVADPPGTFGMGFVALPNVFNQMFWGQFFGFLFFFLLFLAAVTSSLSMLQPAIAFLEEGLGLNRKASVTLLGFITLMGVGFIVFFSKGFTALDTIDFWIGTFGIYVLSTIQVILFAWVHGIDRGMEELDRGAEIRIPRFVKYLIKYIAPTYLLTIFGVWIFNEFIKIPNAGQTTRIQAIMTDRVVQFSIGFIVVILLLFILLIAQATKRWDRHELAQTEVSP